MSKQNAPTSCSYSWALPSVSQEGSDSPGSPKLLPVPCHFQQHPLPVCLLSCPLPPSVHATAEPPSQPRRGWPRHGLASSVLRVPEVYNSPCLGNISHSFSVFLVPSFILLLLFLPHEIWQPRTERDFLCVVSAALGPHKMLQQLPFEAVNAAQRAGPGLRSLLPAPLRAHGVCLGEPFVPQQFPCRHWTQASFAEQAWTDPHQSVGLLGSCTREKTFLRRQQSPS